LREAPLGQRKYRLALWSLLCGTVLGFSGIAYGRELIGVASIIAAILASVGATFAAGNGAEWKARASGAGEAVDSVRRPGA
jgi:hypothetical protein